jgi:DNA-binding PadR family transcriptional regulator
LCQQAFSNDTVPNKGTIYGIITKFEENGCVCDRKHNRRRTVLNYDTLEDVGLSLLRKLSQQKNMSLGRAHTAVHLIHLRVYRTHEMYELRPTDDATRLRYCNCFKAFVRNNIRLLDKFFFTAEARFHLNGYVNSQNEQIWCSENSHAYYEIQCTL